MSEAIPRHPEIQAQIVAASTGAPPPSPAPSAPEPTSAPNQSSMDVWPDFDKNHFEAPGGPAAPAGRDVLATPPGPPASPPPSGATPAPGASDPLFDLPDLPAAHVPGTAPVQPQVPSAPPPSPGAASPPAVPDMATLQKQAIDHLMANEYRLDDADRTRLLSEPDAVLPKLAARMHVGIAAGLAQQLAQALPALIQAHVKSMTDARGAELEFYSRYPTLNREQFKPIVMQSLQQVRTMNPNLSREQLFEQGAAWAAFQIRRMAQPQAPRAPQAPFVPTMGSSGSPAPTNPAQSNNPFTDLAGDADLFNTW